MSSPIQAYEHHAKGERRDELIVEHLDYVRHVVGRIAVNLPATCDRDDLESAGIIGLIEAAQQFDADRNVPFAKFAFLRIRGAVYDELRRNTPVSQVKLQNIAAVRNVYQRIPPPLTLEMLVTETGLPQEEVWECLELMRLLRPEPWAAIKEVALPAAVSANGDASEELERKEALSMLADAIEQLPDQERLAVTLYHLEELRLKEIGEVMGLSESRVSRIVQSAEFLLKEFLRAKYAE